MVASLMPHCADLLSKREEVVAGQIFSQSSSVSLQV